MHSERGPRAQGVPRPAWRGEVPYAEPATADEVRALAARVRRRMWEREQERVRRVDVHELVEEAARARGLIETEAGGVLALKASSELTPCRGYAFEVTDRDRAGPVSLFVRPVVFDVASLPGDKSMDGVRVPRILAVVARRHGMTVTDLTSARRGPRLVVPRQIAAWLARTLTGRSLPEIGRHMGGRDHTTILHSVRKIDAMRAADPAFAAHVDALADEIADRMAIREVR